MSLPEMAARVALGVTAGAMVSSGVAVGVGFPPAGPALVGGGFTGLAMALGRGKGTQVRKVGQIVVKSKDVERYERRGRTVQKIPVFARGGAVTIDAPEAPGLPEHDPPPTLLAAIERNRGQGSPATCPKYGVDLPFPHACFQHSAEKQGVCPHLERYSDAGGSGWQPRCTYASGATGGRARKTRHLPVGLRTARRGKPQIMNKAMQIQNLKEEARRHGVPDDLIDWDAEVDSVLTYPENRAILLQKIQTLSRDPEKRHETEDPDAEEERARQYHREAEDRLSNPGEHIERLRDRAERGDAVAREELDLFLQELAERDRVGPGSGEAHP